MKKQLLLVMATFLFLNVKAQEKYFTRSGKIFFSASGSMEKIEAVNTKATSVLDTKTGQMEFALLMKAFEFEKELMMEHFNENYVESDKYPKSTFKGTIEEFSKIDLTKDGMHPVKVKGQLTLHGVTKEVMANASLEIKSGKIIGKSNFTIVLADYNIIITALVKDNISKTVKIEVTTSYEKLNSGT